MTRTISAVLVFVLVTSPVLAQDLRSSIRREAVAASTVPQASESENRYPRPFLWTGIGLIAGGGLYLGIAGLAEDLCDDINRSSRATCESNSGLIRGFGFGLMAAGGVILAIGATKRGKASPELVTTAGRGVAIRQKFTF